MIDNIKEKVKTEIQELINLGDNICNHFSNLFFTRDEYSKWYKAYKIIKIFLPERFEEFISYYNGTWNDYPAKVKSLSFFPWFGPCEFNTAFRCFSKTILAIQKRSNKNKSWQRSGLIFVYKTKTNAKDNPKCKYSKNGRYTNWLFCLMWLIYSMVNLTRGLRNGVLSAIKTKKQALCFCFFVFLRLCYHSTSCQAPFTA